MQENPALAAMLVAADEIVTHWRSDAERLEASWAEYERASLAEGETRRSLMAILRTMVQLTTARPAGRLPPSAPRAVGNTEPPGPSGSATAHVDSSALRLPAGADGANLSACLFGSFRLFRGGLPLESWPGARTAGVLCYLLAQRGRAAHRELLMELFWPEADPEQARRSLHQTIYVLRKAIRTQRGPPEHVIYENDCYTINPRIGLWCDVDQFEAQIDAGRSAERHGRTGEAMAGYERAGALYVGDYLEDQPYEDWAAAERDRLRLLHLDTSNRLAELRLARGDIDTALEVTQGVLRREPCDEVAHRRALRCLAATGNRALVVRHYRRYTDTLRDSLGLAPSRETKDLYNSLMT